MKPSCFDCIHCVRKCKNQRALCEIRYEMQETNHKIRYVIDNETATTCGFFTLQENLKMNRYGVKIPIAGFVYYEVEANSVKEAKEKAWELVNEGVEGDINWEFFDIITEGNVSHAPCNEIEVDKLK